MKPIATALRRDTANAIRRVAYRPWSRLLHRYNFHHASVLGPIEPDGAIQDWCQWCGLRMNRVNTKRGIPAADRGDDLDWDIPHGEDFRLMPRWNPDMDAAFEAEKRAAYERGLAVTPQGTTDPEDVRAKRLLRERNQALTAKGDVELERDALRAEVASLRAEIDRLIEVAETHKQRAHLALDREAQVREENLELRELAYEAPLYKVAQARFQRDRNALSPHPEGETDG